MAVGVDPKIARQANRAVFYRTLSVLCVVGLFLIGWFRINDVQKAEDPCSITLHGEACQTRSCLRAQDITPSHKVYGPICRDLIQRYRAGQIDIGPGAPQY